EHLAFFGRPVGGGEVGDFALVVEDSREAFAALGAAQASFTLDREGGLVIDLTDGVVVGGGLGEEPLRFGRSRVEAQLAALVRDGSGPWRKADSRPLPRLAADARQARAVAGRAARRAANRYAVEPLYRLLLAALPLLVALQLSLCLSTLPPLGDRALPSLVACGLVCVLSAWMISGARSVAADAPRMATVLLGGAAVAPGAVVWLVLRAPVWRS
ncbi:MAG: hypothetical protein QGI46_03260, partial [Planctomycetota bacterium]|nr:hypothetical protein [Planctomycetota bacterium]